jgi:hypothetical protein
VPSKPTHLFPETLHITPATLVELAPRLVPYMPARANDKDWPSIIEAALFLSGEMGINRTLWARACAAMGREYAAVAMAIVSTRPAEHFTSGPGGYFAGMLRKFEKNPQDLCLSRTLWKLKDEIWGAQGHKERREREKARRRSFGPDPVMTSAGGFMPVGTVLQRQAAAPMPPVHRALPAPVGSAAPSSVNSKAWRPSPALIEDARQVGLRVRQQQQREDGTKSTLAKPENGAAGAMPQDGDKH